MKLDTFDMIYDRNDLTKVIKLKTQNEKRVHPGNTCDLVFTPMKTLVEGADLAFSAFVQTMVYGAWNGKCTITGPAG